MISSIFNDLLKQIIKQFPKFETKLVLITHPIELVIQYYCSGYRFVSQSDIANKTRMVN